MKKVFTMQKMSLAALLMTSAWSLPGQASIAVVVNPSSGASSITQSDAERLFLGKDKNLAGAGAVVPMDQAEGSKARAEFLQKVLNKNESQLKAYWSQLIFTGKGTPPAAVADDAAVKSWLASHANGISYIDSKAVDGSVKVLLKVE